ncbi:membrane protein [Enterococcus faecium UC8668]|nr:membrane protein [Enterococcus faecium UC8668]
MIVILKIISMLSKVYRNKINQVLNSKEKRIGMFLSVFIIIGISALLANILTHDVVSIFLNGNLEILYSAILTYLISLSIFTFSIFIVLKFLDPDESKILKNLDRLPISKLAMYIGYYSFPLSIQVAIPSILFSIIIIPQLVTNGISVSLSLRIAGIFLLQSIFITLLMNLSYNILFFLGIRMKIPFAKSVSLLVQTIIILRIVVTLLENIQNILLNYETFSYNILFWNLGFLGHIILENTFSVNLLLLVLVELVMFIACIHSFALLSSIQDKNEYQSKVFAKINNSKSLNISLILKDMKLLLRSENTILLILLLLGLNTFTLLSHLPILGILIKIDAGLLGTLGFLSYGVDEKMLSFYRILGVKRSQYFLGKFISTFVVTSFFFLLMLLFKVPSLRECLFGLGILATSTLSSIILGVFFPYSKENPLSQTSLILVCVLGLFPITYLINLFNSYSSIIQIILVTIFIVTGFIITNHVFNTKWEKERL